MSRLCEVLCEEWQDVAAAAVCLESYLVSGGVNPSYRVFSP